MAKRKRVRAKTKNNLKNHTTFVEKIIEFGLIGLIIFSPLPAASVHDWSILVIQMTVLVLMVGYFIATEKKDPDLQRKNTPGWPNWLFFGFWGFVLLQCFPLPKFLAKLLSPQTFIFQQQYVPDFSSMKFISLSLAPSISLKSGLALLPYFLIGFLIVKSIKKRSQIVRMFSVIFFVGVFESVYGLAALFGDSNFVTGTFINRNHFAGYMEMMIPLGLGLMFSLEDSGKKASVSRLVISLGVIVMSLALIFSRSRSGILILALIFVLFLSLNFVHTKKRKDHKRGAKILLISIFIIIIILSLFFGVDSILQRFSKDTFIRESRLDIWGHTLGIVADFPVFGSGLGTFVLLYPVMEADGELIKTSHAHNDYLEYLSELGITGMVLLIGGIFYIFVSCFLKWRVSRHPLMKGLGLGGMVAVFSLLVHGFTDFNFQIPSNILLFSVVLSLTFVAVTYQPSKDR